MWTEAIRATCTPCPSKPPMQYSILYPPLFDWEGNGPMMNLETKIKIAKSQAAWVSKQLLETNFPYLLESLRTFT